MISLATSTCLQPFLEIFNRKSDFWNFVTKQSFLLKPMQPQYTFGSFDCGLMQRTLPYSGTHFPDLLENSSAPSSWATLFPTDSSHELQGLPISRPLAPYLGLAE